ncbi:MAG: purine-nucleoside phosphorylase [Aquincola sp.]|nr:purine-nucleoside phosphorylase [Aquincola sp.]MDH4288463.1 purine-nucleoside phosphorylase [Aquincola sp.]MDH5331058.1 purine-nucleoside phosphorylase [Aquincola sp.]
MSDNGIDHAQRVIAQRVPGRAPRIGIVLGSGWNGAADHVTDAIEIAYADLPGFPAVGVAGHGGTLRVGRLGGCEVALMIGREHVYEHGRTNAMAGAVRTLARCGVRTLVVTNAAGSLDTTMPPGALMLITDHLNMVQRSPLAGDALSQNSERFVDMRDAYAPDLRATAQGVARHIGLSLHEGVYAWMLGPQFETPAEIRMLRQLGAQAVGMSTVPEVILARHAGLAVLGLSMITNLAAGMDTLALSHAQTLAVAAHAAADATRLLEALMPELDAVQGGNP